MRVTPYIIAVVLIDLALSNIDRLWASDTAVMQFFVYDLATFGRIGMLAASQGLLIMLHDKIRIKRIDTILWGLYWAYALYTFKLWLDIQSGFVHG